MNEILLILLVFLGAQLFLGPILVRLTIKQPVNINFGAADSSTFPSDARSYFTRISYEIRLLGFDDVADLAGVITGAPVYARLFINREMRESAMAIRAGKPPLSFFHYLEYYSQFSDGRGFCTNNSREPVAFDEGPEKKIVQLTFVKDINLLYKIHRGESLDFSGGTHKILPSPGQEIAFVLDSITRTYENAVIKGFFYLDHSSLSFRPTLIGSIKMTWKLIWPIKQIRKFINKQKALRIFNKYKNPDSKPIID